MGRPRKDANASTVHQVTPESPQEPYYESTDSQGTIIEVANGKVPGLGKELTISARCEHCVYFKKFGYYGAKGDPNKRHRVPCIDLGVIETSKPCSKFQVDPTYFDFRDVEGSTVLLGRLLAGLDKKELPAFSALINQEIKTRKRGFSYGQAVWLRIYGDDYISNYAKAYVITASPTQLRIQGKRGFNATVFHQSVFTEKQWKKKRAELEAKGLFKDPNLKKYKTVQKIKDVFDKNYEPPTLDKFVVETGSVIKKKKGDLVDLVSGAVEEIAPKFSSTGRELRQRSARRAEREAKKERMKNIEAMKSMKDSVATKRKTFKIRG